MNRRSFLKWLGLGAVAAPAAVKLAQTAIAPKPDLYPRAKDCFAPGSTNWFGVPVRATYGCPPGQAYLLNTKELDRIMKEAAEKFADQMFNPPVVYVSPKTYGMLKDLA